MMSCDLRLIMQDLAIKKVSVSSKRTAYLVPNMFNKIVSGYKKDKSKVSIQSDTSIESKKTFQDETVNVRINENNVQNQTVNVEKNEKTYESKVLPSDVDLLRTIKFKIGGEPRKLLISTVFIQKLFSHRINEVKANILKKTVIPTATPVSSSSSTVVPTVNEVKEDVVVTKNNEINIPTQNTPKKDPVQDAVTKYVELMNTRKQVLLEKQRCEKEMTDLVNQYGITLDMVNAEIAKGDNK